MSEFFLAALSFGLAAGIKPGPLGIIVIQQALSRGLFAGVQASLAPLITDGPIIVAALWILPKFSSIDAFTAALSLTGGIYLLWVSTKLFRVSEISLGEKMESRISFATVLKINFLSPAPYLFWFTVGGNYLIRGSTAESTVFVTTTIGALIATKTAVAVLAVRFFPSLGSRGYILTMKFLAATLVWFGLVFIFRAGEIGLHYARSV